MGIIAGRVQVAITVTGSIILVNGISLALSRPRISPSALMVSAKLWLLIDLRGLMGFRSGLVTIWIGLEGLVDMRI
jgi:hypothetical protein